MPSRTVAEVCFALAEHAEGLEAVISGKSYVPLLALLEHPLSEVQNQIESSLLAVGVSAERCTSISLERLVVFALQSWGSHWPALAVGWLEAGMPINSAIAEVLRKASSNKSLPQSVRHRAFALSNRWQRTQQGEARK